MSEHHLGCHEMLSTISDYVEGELSPELCHELEEHLSGCENCRIVVNTFKKTIDLVHGTSTESMPLPEPIKARLMSALGLDKDA